MYCTCMCINIRLLHLRIMKYVIFFILLDIVIVNTLYVRARAQIW